MNKYVIVIVSLVFSLSSLFLKAQELPEVISPSPTVASLMHFEEVPIDYYSGQPNIQFPIYSKNLGSGVTVPITLRYSTMGLRIDERSGWVGTGWALDGEAVISRTVRHIRDEANEAEVDVDFNGKFEVGVYHNNFFNLDFSDESRVQNFSNLQVQNFLWNASGKGSSSFGNFGNQTNGAFDRELDLYQLSLFGNSARFLIIKNSSNELEVKMLSNDSNLKVEIEYNITTFSISHFTVTDTNGVIYLMDVTETNSTLSGSGGVLQNNSQMNISSNLPTTYISAWKVREIRNSTNQLLATYSYQPIEEEFNLPMSYTESIVAYSSFNMDLTIGNVNNGSNNDPYGFKAYNASLMDPKRIFSVSSVTIQSQKLSSILFRDQSSVNFILSTANHPEYSSSGRFLEDIEILDENGIVFKRFDFIFSENLPNHRLFLDRIEEHFKTNSEVNIFNLAYNNKNELPATSNMPWLNDSKKDLWGYYKHEDPPFSPIPYWLPEKSADKDAVITGSLLSISYPTGGKKEFVFESNTFSHMGSRPFNNHEFKIYNKDNWDFGDPSIPSNARVIFNSTSSGQATNNESNIFEITDEQEVQFIGKILQWDNSNSFHIGFIENTGINLYELDQNDNIIYPEVAGFKYSENELLTLPIGRYKMVVTILDISPPTNINMEGTLFFKRFKSNLNKFIYGGGLRIQKVIFKDANDTVERVTNYSYEDQTTAFSSLNRPSPSQSSEKYSTGVIDGFLTNIKEYKLTKSHPFLASTGTGGNDQHFSLSSGSVTYNVKEYLNSVYISMTKGGYVGYRKVSVYDTECETIGCESANGISIYEYTSAVDFPTYDLSYGWPFLPIKDKSYLQGALIKQKIYNQSNLLLKEVTNIYDIPIEIPQAQWLFTYDNNSCGWTQLYKTYTQYLAHFPNSLPPGMQYADASFFDNCITPIPNAPVSVDVPVFYNIKEFYFTKYLVKETISKDYFYDSFGVQSFTKQRQKFQYNPYNYQISQQDSYYKEKGIDEHYQTNYYYPNDNTHPSSSNTAIRSQLIGLNKINEVLERETFKNGIKISQANTIYEDFDSSSNDLILPQSVETAKGTDTVEEHIKFHTYDSYGNPLEVSKTGGTHISYVWGYDHTLPVAKVVNATYSDIESLPSFGVGFSLTEGLSTAQENELRGLVEAQISTFEYDPMVGVISTTDARDYKSYYAYDDFNRLQNVKDQDNYLLSENEYVYGVDNYVKTTAYQVKTLNGTTLPNTSTPLTDDDKIESITYVDGLGRPIQSIAKQAGGNHQDIISPIVYDVYGRQPIEYLPYVDASQAVGTANLNYRDHSQLLIDLEDYYVNKYQEDVISPTSINAFSERIFENSPLNRIIEQAAPGNDWNYHLSNVNTQTITTDISNEVEDYFISFSSQYFSPSAFVGEGSVDIISNQLTFNFNGFWDGVLQTGNILFLNTSILLDDIVLGQLQDGNNTLIPYYLEIQDGYLIITSTDPFFPVNSVVVSFNYSIPTTKTVTFDQQVSKNNTIKFEYQANTSSDKVSRYKVIFPTLNTEDPQLYYDDYYSAGELYKTIIKDENWQADPNPNIVVKDHTTEEYKDSQGRVILKRTYTNEIAHNTYYVYDDYGNLTYVLSPKGSDLVLNGNEYQDFTDNIKPQYFVPTDKYGPITGSDGAAVVIVDKSKNTLQFKINIDFNDPINLETGPISQLSYTLPNMIIGIFGGYTVSIQDGYLFMAGSGIVTAVNENFTLTLPTYFVVTQEIDDLCYQYHYDKRNRLIEKKIPQKGWEYIVYDNLDRPILTQDANLKTSNHWLMTKYDDFDRVIFTGKHYNSDNRADLQNTLNNQTLLNESPSTTASSIDGADVYYTNTVFPTNNIIEWQTINYYDTYTPDVSTVFSNPVFVYGVNVTSNTKALPTGSRVRALGSGGWTTTATYYDEKARPLYIGSDNMFLGTKDIIETKLDFIGKPIEVRSTHIKAGVTTVITDNFIYDHTGRLLNQKQRIGTSAQELIVSNTYDELGQLKNKGVGNIEASPLQTVDYTYNIRGWLKTINDVETLGNDLFSFKLNYNTTEIGSTNTTALYNGNISETIWKTANDVNANNETRGYAYAYDDLNRFTRADYGIKTTGSFDLSSNYYNVYNLNYDKNGNILSLRRVGELLGMDNLTYSYDGNQLTKVDDTVTTTEGFIDGNTVGDDYSYDVNGNMTEDKNKNITSIEYNYLNLPIGITFNNDSDFLIEYFYDATGVKLMKVVTNVKDITTTKYAGNFIYEDTGSGDVLKFFSHPEGYVEPDGQGDYSYVYQYKDHLGNIRLAYSDSDGNGTINSTTEIIEENNYYPFGLKHKGYNNVVNGVDHPYGFGGKEEQNEFNGTLQWLDFSARNYDPALGRWMNIDPLAEKFVETSPYVYAKNNPVFFVDPNGQEPVPGPFTGKGWRTSNGTITVHRITAGQRYALNVYYATAITFTGPIGAAVGTYDAVTSIGNIDESTQTRVGIGTQVALDGASNFLLSDTAAKSFGTATDASGKVLDNAKNIKTLAKTVKGGLGGIGIAAALSSDSSPSRNELIAKWTFQFAESYIKDGNINIVNEGLFQISGPNAPYASVEATESKLNAIHAGINIFLAGTDFDLSTNEGKADAANYISDNAKYVAALTRHIYNYYKNKEKDE